MLKTTPAVRPASILFRSLSVFLISALLVPAIVIGESGSSEFTLQRALVKTRAVATGFPPPPSPLRPNRFTSARQAERRTRSRLSRQR